MDFLKTLFDGVEGGKLSFDEFKAACKNDSIKLANLATGDYVAKQKYTDDIGTRDTRIKSLEDTLANRDNDLKDVKTQLENAGVDREKLSSLTTQLNDLQNKYTADTKKLEADMLAQRKTYAVKEYANSKKFTSQAARRDFEHYLMTKEFSMSDDGVLMGGEDFVKEYSKDNADAFVVDAPESKQPENNPLPQFVSSTPGGSNGGDTKAFHFNFAGVRPAPTQK